MEMEIIGQLVLAAILGSILGIEREIKRKEAGLQTYSLVALGTCLFTILSFYLYQIFESKTGIRFDPTGLIQAIAIGIGFIGAGVIFRQPSGIVGLTTAAGLWVCAGIGIAVGIKDYLLAVFTTFLTLLIFSLFGFFEKRYLEKIK
jgi:putative Mg2+ transporter-C (MgtC) family protein